MVYLIMYLILYLIVCIISSLIISNINLIVDIICKNGQILFSNCELYNYGPSYILDILNSLDKSSTLKDKCSNVDLYHWNYIILVYLINFGIN